MAASFDEILVLTQSPAANATSVHQPTLRWDHLGLFIKFVLGSLTSVDISLVLGSTEAGTIALADFDAFDANQSQILQSFTSSFTGWMPLSTQNTATRMNPAAITSDTWAIKAAITGSAAGSTLDVWVRPFGLGRSRD